MTVPVLVYLLGHEGKPAIAESLAIVGGISLAGAIPYGYLRQIDWRSVFFFGVPGMFGTYGGAWIAKFVPSTVQLILFAAVMLLAAWIMFRQVKPTDSALGVSTEKPHKQHPLWQIILEGSAVGVVGTFVGSYVGSRFNQQVLQRTFAVFLLVMGIFVLSQEIPKLGHHTPTTPSQTTNGSEVSSIRQSAYVGGNNVTTIRS